MRVSAGRAWLNFRVFGVEESHVEDNCDLDYPATNRSAEGIVYTLTPAMRHPVANRALCEALALYMMTGPEDEEIYPSLREVVDVMDAAEGATEDKVLRCLSYLREERGLRPATRNGPRHFSWFPTVVGDYFRRRHERHQAADPTGVPDVGFSQAQFESMTGAIEI